MNDNVPPPRPKRIAWSGPLAFIGAGFLGALLMMVGQATEVKSGPIIVGFVGAGLLGASLASFINWLARP